MAKICIDAGHGGKDSGGTGLGRKEKDDVLSLAKKIQALLQDQGIKVVMTRTNDKYITIAERTTLANDEKCDYFLSVHRDAFNDASANGSSIYIYSKASAATEKKAQTVYEAVIKASGFRKRGLKKGAANYTDYGVNKNTVMPAALLELGFITNKGDNDIFDKKSDDISLELAKALCSIVGVKYLKVTSNSTTANKPVLSRGITVKEWQLAAQKDGFKFPKYGADGKWGKESKSVAKKAVCKRYWLVYKNKNLTKLVQAAVGVTADGKFGSNTEKAVIAYQKANKLTVDGVVGLNTWKAILRIK